MRGNQHTVWQAFEVFVRTSNGLRLTEYAAAPTINELGQIDPHSQVCWLECPADLDESFEVVLAFHDRRSWHVRADLFADGEYIDGRRFQPGCLRPWTFDKISQHQDDVVYRSKLAFGKIVNTRHRLRNWVDEQELTEEEHEAIPIQKLQELGEIRVTFKPGKIQMRHVGPPRGPRRHNDGHTGPKKVYERHKKAKLDRTVHGTDGQWERRRQRGDRNGELVSKFVPHDRGGPGYTFRFKYLSRELLLANGVIEVKGESGGNRPLIEGGSDEKDEKQRSDVKPDFSKGPTSSRASSYEPLQKPDISVLGGTARNFIGSALQPIDLTNS